jgi:hypothetical protein
LRITPGVDIEELTRKIEQREWCFGEWGNEEDPRRRNDVQSGTDKGVLVFATRCCQRQGESELVQHQYRDQVTKISDGNAMDNDILEL